MIDSELCSLLSNLGFYLLAGQLVRQLVLSNWALGKWHSCLLVNMRQSHMKVFGVLSPVGCCFLPGCQSWLVCLITTLLGSAGGGGDHGKSGKVASVGRWGVSSWWAFGGLCPWLRESVVHCKIPQLVSL